VKQILKPNTVFLPLKRKFGSTDIKVTFIVLKGITTALGKYFNILEHSPVIATVSFDRRQHHNSFWSV